MLFLFPEDVTMQRFNLLVAFIISFLLVLTVYALPPEQPHNSSIVVSKGGDQIRLVGPGFVRTLRITDPALNGCNVSGGSCI
jgi:hypothetical protein